MLSYDSPIMRGLSKMTDLVILNLITLVFCIPIVTIGTSITAAHYAALKLCRGEGYVVQNFWKSFKENFIQSTLIWLILAIYIIATGSAIHILRGMNHAIEPIIMGVIFAGLLVCAILFLWVFPLQSRFVNRIGATFKNAFYLAFKHLFKTLCMLLIFVVLFLIVLVLHIQWYSILILFGISVPIYLCAIQYDKVFEELEEMILKSEGIQ